MLDSVSEMAKNIVSILGGDVHSIWLYGSVVQDDFRLGWSDIDILVLTRKQITNNQARELVQLRQVMSADAPDNPYYSLFEGVIANLDEYMSGTFRRLVYWGTTGQRITDRYKPDPFSQYELARYSRSVYGNDEKSIFTVPGKETLIEAVRSYFEMIRKYAQQTDERLYSCGWLLDICRCIYTLRYYNVISKTQAGIWALQEHIFPDEDPLRKTIEIRKEPMVYKNREDIRQWLKGLGPVIQEYADVLELELSGIKKITFPEHEYDSVQKWLDRQGFCYTTRVYKEVGKYKAGESYLTPWGDVLRIDDVQTFTKVSDRPFFDEMSEEEKDEIRKYSENMGLPYEFIRLSRLEDN